MGFLNNVPTVAALIFGALLFLHGLGFASPEATENAKKLYIVYLGERQHEDADLVTASHHSMLASVLGSKEEATESIVYSYKHGFSGFSAMLTESQARSIQGLPGVLSVRVNQLHSTHTTRSWDFMGLHYNQPNGILANAKMGEGIIIGVIDSAPQCYLGPEGEGRFQIIAYASKNNFMCKGLFGTAPLQIFQLCSTNSTMEQLHCGVPGAGGPVWHAV